MFLVHKDINGSSFDKGHQNLLILVNTGSFFYIYINNIVPRFTEEQIRCVSDDN